MKGAVWFLLAAVVLFVLAILLFSFIWVIPFVLFAGCLLILVGLMVVAILFVFLIPYYAIKKKPELETMHKYSLDDVKDVKEGSERKV